MEDVLDVYEHPLDERCPVIGFDEKPCQLVDHVLLPIPPKPGRLKRVDSEYKRQGIANLFGWVEPLTGKRDVWVTERRTTLDYAHALKRFPTPFQKRKASSLYKTTSTLTKKLPCTKPSNRKQHVA